MQFRKTTYEQFAQVFNIATEEETEAEGTEAGSEISNKWGWYQTIFSLANENILDIDKVVNKPAYECLTFMAYRQDLNKKRQDEHRQHTI